MRLELPRWYDLHAHFRQGNIIAPLLDDHLKMGCAGILAMPNTKPPVAKVFKADSGDAWSIEDYRDMLLSAGGDRFDDMIVPLYLTADTTPAMIAKGAKSGLLRAAKYYPPHGTTGAAFGAPFTTYIENGVLKALEDNGVVLCIHGEEHGLSGEDYFGRHGNAEERFYRQTFPQALDACPNLKIVGEHVTTKIAVDAVTQAGSNVAATITPQHLLYTVGHLLQGLKYHLYCLPLLKFEDDLHALRGAIKNNPGKFFAGTDSAPHVKKMTPCGCAAGCYTGGIAPQMYAQAFEAAGIDLSGADGLQAFKDFLCLNGARFYGLKNQTQTFTLIKTPQTLTPLPTPDGIITPLPLGLSETATLPWSLD